MSWKNIQTDDSEHWVAGDERLELLVQTIPGHGEEPPTYFWLITSGLSQVYSMGMVKSPDAAMACADTAARDWREP